MIRVVLPAHLKTLARVDDEVSFDLNGTVTIESVVEAIEERFPVLRGTIRDFNTMKRRPLVRFYACKEDWSHEPLDTPLPDTIANGEEPLLIVGAMAGG